MKLAILADLHIGYPRFAEDAYLQAQEALEAASQMADVILIAGDVFDSRAPRPESLAQAINLFMALSNKEWHAKIEQYNHNQGKPNNADVPVIAISGTHERLAEGKDNALNLLGLAGLLVDTSEAFTVIKKADERVAVFGFGGVSEERTRQRLHALEIACHPNAFNVFMFHQSVQELLPFSEDFIKLGELPQGFDLYVCGHVHSRYTGEVHGKPFLIPGSTVITQLKEAEQEPKGFILFDTQTLTHQFIPINSRKFVVVKVMAENSTPMEIEQQSKQQIDQLVANNHSNKPIVRLIVEGNIAEGHTKTELSLNRLTAHYAGSAFVEVDTSRLAQQNMQSSIEQLREGKIDNLSIRELGAVLLNAELDQLKADRSINYALLFEVLASKNNKEQMLKEADALLFSQGA